MKTCVLYIAFSGILAMMFLKGISQDIIIGFTGEVMETEMPVTLDSATIESLRYDASVTLYGNSSFNLTTGEIIIGINEIQGGPSCKVYPNPINSYGNIVFQMNNPANVNISIYNIYGQTVANWNQNLNSGLH